MKITLAKLLFSLLVLTVAFSRPAEANCVPLCLDECYDAVCASNPNDSWCSQSCKESCDCECGITRC
jgi:hypothetical protein